MAAGSADAGAGSLGLFSDAQEQPANQNVSITNHCLSITASLAANISLNQHY